jgi:hypothetical protein
MNDATEIFAVLQRHEVPFIIVGGHAVYLSGYPEQDVEELAKSSVEVKGLRFVSLSWLRRMKEAAGRSKDKMDLENLPPG